MSRFPHKNRAAVERSNMSFSLKIFILAQEKKKYIYIYIYSIFLIFGPSGFDSVSTLVDFFSTLFDPSGPRGPGKPFFNFWGVSGPKGPNNSCEGPRSSQHKTWGSAEGSPRFAPICSDFPVFLHSLFYRGLFRFLPVCSDLFRFSPCRKRSPAKGVRQKSDEKSDRSIRKSDRKVTKSVPKTKKVIELLLPHSFCGTLRFVFRTIRETPFCRPLLQIPEEIATLSALQTHPNFQPRSKRGRPSEGVQTRVCLFLHGRSNTGCRHPQ